MGRGSGSRRARHELLERYGYGTLVVGMPLWFAVPPGYPFRAENAVDDFMTRTTLGLEEVRKGTLRRRDCPFGKVILMWDTTPQALREWSNGRSAQYEDAANTSLENTAGDHRLIRNCTATEGIQPFCVADSRNIKLPAKLRPSSPKPKSLVLQDFGLRTSGDEIAIESPNGYTERRERRSTGEYRLNLI